MLLWFAVPTMVAVFAVFRDASLDYRLIALGAVLPDVIDGVAARRVAWFHSVVMVMAVLLVAVVGTIGRRPLRKRLLAIPIGMFGHLVLDGAWLNATAFWWPITNGSSRRLPVLDRGIGLVIAQEFVGVVLAVYFVRRVKLTTPARRRLFVRTGTVDPRLVAPEANPQRRRGRQR